MRASWKAEWNVSVGARLFRKRSMHLKTPTTDDPKPKRENLGPTGPAKVSGGNASSGSGDASNTAGSAPSGEPGTDSELEKAIDRKRTQTPPD